MRENSKFCPNCGATLDSASKASTVADAVAGYSPTHQHSANTSMPTVAPVYSPQRSRSTHTPPSGNPAAYNSGHVNSQPYTRSHSNARSYSPSFNDMAAGKDMSVGAWMLTLFLMCIPVVGIVMLFMWAFGSNAPEFKRNFARAVLIFAVIVGVLTAIFMLLGLGAFLSMLR